MTATIDALVAFAEGIVGTEGEQTESARTETA